MDHMRRCAYASVLRACGFAALAIFCFMFGTAFDLQLSLRAGGVFTTIVMLALLYKAQEALTKDYRKSEMWMMLPKDLWPPEAVAKRMGNLVLHETYLNVAKYTALISAVMWAAALVFRMFLTQA